MAAGMVLPGRVLEQAAGAPPSYQVNPAYAPQGVLPEWVLNALNMGPQQGILDQLTANQTQAAYADADRQAALAAADRGMIASDGPIQQFRSDVLRPQIDAINQNRLGAEASMRNQQMGLVPTILNALRAEQRELPQPVGAGGVPGAAPATGGGYRIVDSGGGGPARQTADRRQAGAGGGGYGTNFLPEIQTLSDTQTQSQNLWDKKMQAGRDKQASDRAFAMNLNSQPRNPGAGGVAGTSAAGTPGLSAGGTQGLSSYANFGQKLVSGLNGRK